MFGWRRGALRNSLAVVTVAGLLVAGLLVAGLSAACGESDDPYSGEWTTGNESMDLSIVRTEEGWRVETRASTFDAHEEDGMLVSAGGRTTFERRGDELAMTVVPGAEPVMYSKK